MRSELRIHRINFARGKKPSKEGYQERIEFNPTNIVVGFRYGDVIYHQTKIRDFESGEIIFDGTAKEIHLRIPPVLYVYRWSHIERILYSGNRLIIEWDFETGPQIKLIDEDERTLQNPLGLTSNHYNTIAVTIKDMNQLIGIKSKLKDLPIKEADQVSIERLHPTPFVLPPDSEISLEMKLMIESLLSFSIPRERIQPDFWKLIHENSPESVKLALRYLYEKASFMFDPTKELQEALEEIKKYNVRKGIESHFGLLESRGEEYVQIFNLDITPTKKYLYGPEIERSNRVLRRYRSHPFNFLRVHFSDEDQFQLFGINEEFQEHFKKIMKEGIILAGRTYTYLAYSNSQFRENSCYFYTPIEQNGSYLTAVDIINSLGTFNADEPAPKQAARIAQCFSTTTGGIKVSDVDMEFPEIMSSDGRYTFSDGVGQMSPKIAEECAYAMNLNYIPSAVQIRLQGCKGMLVLNPELPGREIKIRPSMIKFQSPHEDELEINGYSSYHPAFLNRQIITLLTSLGVENEAFRTLQDRMIKDIERVFEKDLDLSEYMNRLDFTQGFGRTILKMAAPVFGIEDAFLHQLVQVQCRQVINMLIEKTRIYVQNGVHLYGVIDEYGVLEPNEIFVQISDESLIPKKKIITGQAFVTKSPCLHPGDIRKITCVDKPELHHLENVIVFPKKGARPLTDMMSGGDLDGDYYTVIWEPLLFPKEEFPPMDYKKPAQQPSGPIRIPDSFIDFFVQYMATAQLGRIANAWQARAEDLGAKHPTCLLLALLHSDAVDYPKTGIPVTLPKELVPQKYPDFMENQHKESFVAQSFIGESYRHLKKTYGLSQWPSKPLYPDPDLLEYPGSEAWEDEATNAYERYRERMRAMMRVYSVPEADIVSGLFVTTMKKKRRQNALDDLHALFIQLRRDFLKEFEEGTPEENRLAKAAAWYRVAYTAPGKKLLSFAWLLVKYLILIKQMNI